MIENRHEAEGVASRVILSRCGGYRYLLARRWGEGARDVVFVMLNPSTADEFRNDPTIARCEARARAMGFSGLVVVNLFAWRATFPRDLWAATDPVGPGNDAQILAACAGAGAVICGWGNHGLRARRGAAVAAMLRGQGVRLYHLGLTGQGAPRHPLYLPYREGMREWAVGCSP